MDSRNSPHRDRLWTPWRMRYISGGPKEDGCIFCNRLARANDLESLILHRAEHSFVIMNLFPYNTGHIMVVPNDHVPDVDQVDPATISEMARLLAPVTRSLRRVLSCDGFNIGFNQGDIAGAGVAEHLHQHVVPRWQGDANFMPIIAGTMVVPELIPASYAKIRAELESELREAVRFEIVLLDHDDEPSAWLLDEQVPAIETQNGDAVWRQAIDRLGLDEAEIVGWSGSLQVTDTSTPPGLVIRTSTRPSGSGWRRVPLANAEQGGASLPVGARETLVRARLSLAPWIGPDS